ncbi:MAG: hypothetical protein D3922_06900, partial [Candidatus Electrothrix sp. AR1]|nr:hypothetical protein [Candidatus Electrothrix sp. AR1]
MLLDLYSKRRKRERGEFSDVYQYEDIPHSLRVQVVHMLKEAFTTERNTFSGEANKEIKKINEALCREYGIFKLADENDEGFNELTHFLLQTKNYEQVLDVIELTFQFIDKSIRQCTSGLR